MSKTRKQQAAIADVLTALVMVAHLADQHERGSVDRARVSPAVIEAAQTVMERKAALVRSSHGADVLQRAATFIETLVDALGDTELRAQVDGLRHAGTA